VPKVHHKPIKSPRKGSNKKSKKQPKAALVWRTGLSGVPPDSVRCNTRQCPMHQGDQLRTCHLWEFWEPLRYNSPDCTVYHRTVWCAMRSNGYLRQRSSATATGTVNSARLRAQSQSRCQMAHQTVNSVVWCTTGLSGGPVVRSSNGRTPTVG
jgi:hypothetical protein